jgi:hypothetical protein
MVSYQAMCRELAAAGQGTFGELGSAGAAIGARPQRRLVHLIPAKPRSPCRSGGGGTEPGDARAVTATRHEPGNG